MLAKINHFCCYVILLWSFLPIISVFQKSIIVFVPVFFILLLWILTGLNLMRVNSRRICLRCILPFMSIIIIYVLVEYGDILLLGTYRYWLLIGFVVNSIYYIEKIDEQFCKRILLFSLFLLVVTAITTFTVLTTDINASRILTSSSSESELQIAYKQLNVGAFDFIYGLVIIIPLLFFFSIKQENKLYKVIIWCIVALFVLVVLMANYTTAFILLYVDFIFMLLMFFKIKNTFSLLAISLLFYVIAPFILMTFLYMMIDYSGSISTQAKLEGLIDIISNKGSLDDTTSRWMLFLKSVESFSESPIWGVGAYYGSNKYVGQHAQFIDDLARYGLIGCIPLFSLLFVVFKKMKNKYKEIHIYNSRVLVPIFVFISLGFMNPVYVPCILACIFIIVPVVDSFCHEKA